MENVIPISNLYEKINDLLSEFDVKGCMNQYIQNNYPKLLLKYKNDIVASERYSNFIFKDSF